MKRSLFAKAAAVFMAASIALCGCSSDNSGSSSESGVDNSLKKVQDAGKLLLGLDPTFKPMGYTDENDEIVGFDIDVAKEVCKRMGVELEAVPINWDTKESDLNAGTIDCIWNGLSVDGKRAEVMLLSEPYMKNDMVFVVKNGSGYSTMSDLADKTIAVQNGSTAQTILQESEIGSTCTVSALATNVEALQQLELDLVDAVFLDSVVANYEIVTGGKDYVILDDGLYSEEYAIGFRLGDKKLCDEVEKQLKEMKADGTLGEISTKWFGSDVTTIGS